MSETHDLFLRALAVPVGRDKKKKTETNTSSTAQDKTSIVDEPKWPDYILVFDTESRTTVDQSLTFGVWRPTLQAERPELRSR